jgi:hypothetical protein
MSTKITLGKKRGVFLDFYFFLPKHSLFSSLSLELTALFFATFQKKSQSFAPFILFSVFVTFFRGKNVMRNILSWPKRSRSKSEAIFFSSV